ncbi:hypothetical protein [Rhodopirellula baltica]|uniref:hypothetical protein n=1 Tax=Rhodopirellula baltica TaxID=265606 RepID=UPI0002FD340D|nr:hypothetical protein [Rhodopirellula baltica]
MSNPYLPPQTSPKQGTYSRTRFQFAFLNAVLLGVPLAVALVDTASVLIEMQMETARNNGDPVTYQNLYWNFEPHAFWLILAYFAVPNFALFGLHALFRMQK